MESAETTARRQVAIDFELLIDTLVMADAWAYEYGAKAYASRDEWWNALPSEVTEEVARRDEAERRDWWDRLMAGTLRMKRPGNDAEV